MAQQPLVGKCLLIIEASRYDSSGRVISSAHRPLPDKAQHSKETDIHGPCEIPLPAREWPQIHAIDRAATGN